MPTQARIDAAIQATVELAKNEIHRDIMIFVVPANVRSFSRLHDYVDANCYGGLCDEDNPYADVFTFDEEGFARIAVVQNKLDEWLKRGRPFNGGVA